MYHQYKFLKNVSSKHKAITHSVAFHVLYYMTRHGKTRHGEILRFSNIYIYIHIYRQTNIKDMKHIRDMILTVVQEQSVYFGTGYLITN